jgi:uncharacterized membrane protein
VNTTTVYALFGLTGLVLIAVSVPMLLGRVPPNLWYGFRTSKTLSDERIWYEANRLSGRAGIVAGTLMVVLTGLGAVLHWPLAVAPMVVFLLAIGVLVYSLIIERRL